MERLSGLDASFLYLETPTLHMHVSMAAVFDPSTIKGGYSFEQVRDLVSRRLVKAPVFRRRLVEVPFRLGHPYWVDDPAFDIDFHLRRAALPVPGGVEELAEFVGDVCSRQLDRSKPLWQMYIVEGLENENFALVTKMHHSTIDGVSGAELLGQLFDLSPDPESGETDQPTPASSRLPSDAQIVAQAIAARLTKPPRIARLAWKTAFALLDVRKVRNSESTEKAALPLTAPRTSMNAAITAHRRVAFSSISLDEVKRLKNVVGTTVNDVVLAVCTGALRGYLIRRDELPEVPLVATVPVSVQDVESIQGSNRVSAMFVSLPTHLEDPLERLNAISESTKGAKEEHNALGADVLLNWVEYATPTVFAAAARTYSRLKLADRHRPIHNLIISNVPGPGFPLYFSGAEMVAGFPLGPIMEGAGLNITVMSYRGVLNWGLMACRETVAGAGEIAESIPDALDELLVAAGLGKGSPIGIAPAHRAQSRVAEAIRKVGGAKSSRDGRDGTRNKTNSPKKAPAKKTATPKRTATKKANVGEIDRSNDEWSRDPSRELTGELTGGLTGGLTGTTVDLESPIPGQQFVGEPSDVRVVVETLQAEEAPNQEVAPTPESGVAEVGVAEVGVAEVGVADVEQLAEVEPVEDVASPSITRHPSEEELIAELLQTPSLNMVHGVDAQSPDVGSEQS